MSGVRNGVARSAGPTLNPGATGEGRRVESEEAGHGRLPRRGTEQKHKQPGHDGHEAALRSMSAAAPTSASYDLCRLHAAPAASRSPALMRRAAPEPVS